MTFSKQILLEKAGSLKYALAFSLFTIILGVSIFIFVNAKGYEKSENKNNKEKNDSETNSSSNVWDYDVSQDYKFEQIGESSWYGRKFQSRKTASGEIYNMNCFTAAHKYLPFGTIIRVTNTETGKSALVRINDRGPFSKHRIIDLSHKTAEEICAMGTPEVKIEALLNKSDEMIGSKNEIYYFGYSYEFPLVCLPESTINILDVSSDFDNAVRMYDFFLSKNPGKFVYLMQKANSPIEFVSNSQTEPLYYIGLFDPNQESIHGILARNMDE